MDAASTTTDTDSVEMTVREALRDAMAEEMRRDPDIFILGEEVAQYHGAYKVTQGLLEEFGPDRVYDFPITEHGFAGLGVGAALAGLKPIVEFMTWNFAMQATDHIVNSAAETPPRPAGRCVCRSSSAAPTVRPCASPRSTARITPPGTRASPGLKVIQPYTGADFKGLLKSAIRDPNPIIFLESELLYGKKSPVPKDENWLVPIGKARLAREGKDVTIVSFGVGMRHVEAALEELDGQGIWAEVIDLRTLRPLDIDAVIASVKKTHRCVTVEEGSPIGSIGSEISAQLMEKAFDWLDAPVTRITGADVPMPYAANFEKLALPSAKDVVEAVKAVTYK